MKRILAITLTAALAVGVLTATSLITKHIVSENAIAKGYKNGYETGFQKGGIHALDLCKTPQSDSDCIQQYYDVLDKYNQLSDQYNQLREAAIKYVGANYQQSTHLQCTSTMYGINNQYMNTNCN